MQVISFLNKCSVVRSARVAQVEGLFDVPIASESEVPINATIPDLGDDWQIGLIVGASGSGKSSVLKNVFGEKKLKPLRWDNDKSILDCFPSDMSIKDVSQSLSSVGLSSPPSWLRPFKVLSNGEKFRATMARLISSENDLIVVDEYTSVIDRNVAQIASAAISKAIRRSKKKFVAASCHYDIINWIEPDWVFDMNSGELKMVRLRRPDINLEVRRISKRYWSIFKKHHYLNTRLHPASKCFAGFYNGNLCAFSAALHDCGHRGLFRGHRTVCLPDYQGVGIGNAMSNYVGSVVVALGMRFVSRTSHPSMIDSRNKSENWKMISKPGFSTAITARRVMITGKQSGIMDSLRTASLAATFEYVGKSEKRDIAEKLWSENVDG